MADEAAATILARDIEPESGNCWMVIIPELASGDSTFRPDASQAQLFENGKPLGPAHAQHADIRTLGNGRFSHWDDVLYFSASDNSDPRSSGREYTIRGPRREG